MLGIPEWAIGIAAILAVISVLKVVTTRLVPPCELRIESFLQ